LWWDFGRDTRNGFNVSATLKILAMFQIVDDILDITATQEELGKTAGKDLQQK